ncbi:efflux RND transporter periplasmic adaptor subunit [Haloferula sargassicola]|uniref:Multidrug resistance protein MdtA n=1 Tax=Haloferula sargassicola TaxID=490096 RepID=A0ABP9UKI5_9BACT
MSSSRTPLAWLAILALLGVTTYFGLKALRDAKPEEAGAGAGGYPPSTVIFRPAEKKKVVEILEVTGSLRAVRRSEVAARESAAVSALEVDEGDLVKEGQVIARLDPRRMEAQLQEAEATLTAARAELAQREAENERAVRDEEMMRGLWDERAVAEREYLDSVREMKVADARANAAHEAIEAAQKRLELLQVRQGDLDVKAPFDGQVVARHAELGEWLAEGTPVVTMISTGEVEAWLQLPERYVGLLREASPESVEIHIAGRPGSIRADRMSLVPDVDGRSRRFVLIAHIPDTEGALTPGASVHASVPLGRPEERLVVASDAVMQGYDGNFVWTTESAGEGPPMPKRVPVEVAFERDGEAVLSKAELEAGAPVIVEGNERLFPGTPLDPHPWSETRAETSAAQAPKP